MSENKTYFIINSGEGVVKISYDVVASIAVGACLETEGLAAMTAPTDVQSDLTDILTRKINSRGVRIIADEDDSNRCKLELYVSVILGKPIADISEELQRNVKNAVEGATGLAVSGVDVFVTGISLNKK